MWLNSRANSRAKQRIAEVMFALVWSCPLAVTTTTDALRHIQLPRAEWAILVRELPFVKLSQHIDQSPLKLFPAFLVTLCMEEPAALQPEVKKQHARLAAR